MKLIDRKGERYERLTVIDRAPNASKRDTNARWVCRCDCGRSIIAYGMDLRKEKVKSCGCLNAERIHKHGMSRTLIYGVWKQMFQRCRNPKDPSFHNYGGRGINVDQNWERFENFYRDMGTPPPKHSLERKNNNGPYSKENCVWATAKQQRNNTRFNRYLTAFGRTQTIGQWSAEFGNPWKRIRSRIEKFCWTPEDAVSLPLQQGRKPK